MYRVITNNSTQNEHSSIRLCAFFILAGRCTENLFTNRRQFITDFGGFFEFEILSMLKHFIFETFDFASQFFRPHFFVILTVNQTEFVFKTIALIDTVNNVTDPFLNALRRDVVCDVVSRFVFLCVEPFRPSLGAWNR